MNRVLIFAKRWQEAGDDDDPDDNPGDDEDCRPREERSSWMYDWTCDEMNEFEKIQ